MSKNSEMCIKNNQSQQEVNKLSTEQTSHLFGGTIVINYPPHQTQNITWGVFDRCFEGKFTNGLFDGDCFQVELELTISTRKRKMLQTGNWNSIQHVGNTMDYR